jgi:hypothetical protein
MRHRAVLKPETEDIADISGAESAIGQPTKPDAVISGTAA